MVSGPDTQEFAALLARWRGGDQEAAERLLALVYQDLRRLAQQYLAGERPDHTLQATALVHEAYLRLFGEEPPELESRAHFLVLAARQMRRILIDYARQAQSEKRQGYLHRLPLTEADGLLCDRDEDLLALDEALGRLEALYPRAARLVELRFFAGMTEQEAAAALGLSRATLTREWTFAKAWLYDRLRAPARRRE